MINKFIILIISISVSLMLVTNAYATTYNVNLGNASFTGLISSKGKIVPLTNNTQRWNNTQTFQDPLLNGFSFASIYKKSSYTISKFDVTVNVNTTQGGFNTYTNPDIITLPLANTVINSTFTIKKVDIGLGPVMIKTSGSDKIDAKFSNFNLTNSGEFIILQSNSTGYQIYDYLVKDNMGDFPRGTSENIRATSAITGFTPTASAPTSTTLQVTPIYFSSHVRIDTIGVSVGTGVASSTCDLVIYRDNGTYYPSMQVINSFKNVATATSTTLATATYAPPLDLQTGKYWLGSECSTSTTLTINSIPITALKPLGVTSATGLPASPIGWSIANTFSASSLPSSYPTNAVTLNTTPMEVFVRIIG